MNDRDFLAHMGEGAEITISHLIEENSRLGDANRKLVDELQRLQKALWDIAEHNGVANGSREGRVAYAALKNDKRALCTL